MENDHLKELFLNDIEELYKIGITPVIVHGGGPQIAKTLKDLNVVSTFVDGLRVTDAKTLEVAQMVLCGLINKDIVRRLSEKSSVKGAIGLSGLDSKLIQGIQKTAKYGFVGEPTSINVNLIEDILRLQLIPVIAPVGTNTADKTETTNENILGSLNINADTAAGAIAQALKADYFLLLTDIVGVLDKNKVLIDRLPVQTISTLKEDGTISGGMIPKLETAADAVTAGVKAVAIMDGRVEHCVLRALSGEKFGTVVY
jgi:acetylglutamate kinase